MTEGSSDGPRARGREGTQALLFVGLRIAELASFASAMATLPKPNQSSQGRVTVVLGSQWGDEGKGA